MRDLSWKVLPHVRRKRGRPAVLAVLGLFFLISLHAQAFADKKAFKISGIDFGYKVRSGHESISAGLSSLGNIGGFPQKWGMITVTYSSQPKWADDVLLKYFVLVKGRKGKASMLQGEVQYVSVGEGRNHAGLVFVHPNTLARYGKVKRILAQIWHQGVLVDSKQWPSKSSSQWWNKVAPIEGTLRTRFFTPFEHDFEVREEDIKVVSP